MRHWIAARGRVLGVGLFVGLGAFDGAGTGTAWAQFPDAPREPMPPPSERRLAVLGEFDRNKNGHLDPDEREAARKAWAAKKLAERGDRGFFGPPPEIVAEFDENKDGQLDEEEGRIAGEIMGRRFEQMRKDYDKNTNGRLDDDEIAAAIKDVDSGKLKGIPRMFVQFAAGPPGGRRGGPPGPGGPDGPGDAREAEDPAAVVRAADKDHDGRLGATELEVVREAYARRRAAAMKGPGNGNRNGNGSGDRPGAGGPSVSNPNPGAAPGAGAPGGGPRP